MPEQRKVTFLKNVDGASTATCAQTTTAGLTHPSGAELSADVLDRRGWAYGSLGVAVLAVLLPFAPGLISYDTNGILWEAQTGFVRDWWTPFGAFVLGIAYDLEIGLGLVFLVQTVLVAVGLYLCLRLLLRRLPAALGTVTILVFPPMYGQLANLSRDSFYLGLTLLAFGCLCRATTSAGRARGIAVGLALVAALAAFLWRQNGIVTLVVLAAGLVFLALTDRSWRPRRLNHLREIRSGPAAGLAAGVAGCLIGVAAIGASQGSYRLADVVRTHPERSLFVFDLAGISTATDRNAFPAELPRRALKRPGVTPPDISLPALERNFDYSNVIALYFPNGDWTRGLNEPRVAKRELPILQDAWWQAVRDEPGAYLENRLKLAGSQLGFGNLPTDAYYGLLEPTNFNHPIAFVRGYQAASDYITTFSGPTATIRLDFIGPYLLIAAICLVLLWRRFPWARLQLLVMVATPWLALTLLAAISIAAGFRYMVLAVPVALMMVIFATAAATSQTRWGRALLNPAVLEDVGSERTAARSGP
jgi:hypothetical protein